MTCWPPGGHAGKAFCWHSEHRVRQESALLTWQYSLYPTCLPACRLSGSGTVAFTAGHHFAADGHEDPAALAEATAGPLSVIVQVTKRRDCSPATVADRAGERRGYSMLAGMAWSRRTSSRVTGSWPWAASTAVIGAVSH